MHTYIFYLLAHVHTLAHDKTRWCPIRRRRRMPMAPPRPIRRHRHMTVGATPPIRQRPPDSSYTRSGTPTPISAQGLTS